MCELSREVLLLYMIPTLTEWSGQNTAFFEIPGIDHKKAALADPHTSHSVPSASGSFEGGRRAEILPICIYG